MKLPGFAFLARLVAPLALSSVLLSGAPVALQDDAGERIMNQSCGGCHELRTIQVQALSESEWKDLVNAMVSKGAQVKEADLPVLIKYLTTHFGPVPDGPGKEILLNTCTLCHDLKRVKEHGGNRQDWEDTLQSMLNEGAPLSDEEFPVILAYLARNFRSGQ